jgi:pimeloyl-ACP methyl ester carboxylesterase
MNVALPLMAASGAARPEEVDGFADALKTEYQRLEAVAGWIAPTPLITTLLASQSARDFDLIVVRSGAASKRAAIMLHGYMGNWLLLCWLAAESLGNAVDVTLCPSSGVSPEWHTQQASQIVSSTLEYLRALGYDRPYLLGLSAGALGAARVSRQRPNDFSAVVLFYGAYGGGAAPQLPTLYVYGTRDVRFPDHYVLDAAAMQSAAGGDVTVRAIDADHFGLVKRRIETQRAVRNWLVEIARTDAR